MAFTLGPKARRAGTKLFAFDSAGSTNTEALAAFRGGEHGPAWFVTSEQTAGYGRRGRSWIAPRGNLASSVLHVLDVTPGMAATLGFVAGVAVQQGLQLCAAEQAARGANIDVALKWPNDVLLNGRKAVGIGLEAHAMTEGRLAVIVGIGTNIVAAPQGTPFPATSLAAEGLFISAADVFTALSDSWTDLFALWNNGNGFPAIRERWLTAASNLGGEVTVQLGERAVEGVFETIDETGGMIVATPAGRVPVTAGDVYFGTARSAGAA